MISKKLLSEVLDIEIRDMKSVNSTLYINSTSAIEASICLAFGSYESHINIHELAHKCKEWALQYKYEFLSGYLSGRGYVVVMEQRRTWYADTEVEAIFKACEWLLKQKDVK